jgi:phosphoenolpyruvate---glycerone phosphotransferase subunit DhaL
MDHQSILLGRVIDQACAAISNNSSELTRLDQIIGDGDHGINMARGAAVLSEIRDEIIGLPFEEACQRAGMALVMSVGGASGPLFGSCLMAFGKGRAALPATAGEIGRMLEDGIAAVKARGKSDLGEKTMLDVLGPVAAHLGQAGASTPQGVRMTVAAAIEHVRHIEATKGRASFLGKRSIGEIDPGAKSVALIVNAVCDVLEEKP